MVSVDEVPAAGSSDAVTRADPPPMAAAGISDGEAGDCGWDPPHDAPSTADASASTNTAAIVLGGFNDIESLLANEAAYLVHTHAGHGHRKTRTNNWGLLSRLSGQRRSTFRRLDGSTRTNGGRRRERIRGDSMGC
jgi:hypothetical protein